MPLTRHPNSTVTTSITRLRVQHTRTQGGGARLSHVSARSHTPPHHPHRVRLRRSFTRLSVRRALSLHFIVAIVTIIGGLVGASSVQAAGPHVDAIPFVADVTPASAEFVGGAIDAAQRDGATVIVIQLDTFGGDLASMESIHEKELGSKVPIVVFVGPSGAHADSAGAFIALAAPLVVMAPGTRIGSASPVTSSGADLSATERAKTENALVAQITDDQTLYGRNATLAAQMVTQASAFDDHAAIADGIVNFSAADLAGCIRQVDGQVVTLVGGSTVTIHSVGLPVDLVQPTIRDQLFGLLVDANVLFLLFILAAVCIYLELSHPGAIVPGVVGGIALLLFLFGAGSLAPNWAGLALMLLAVVLLAIDVRAPTHGVLTIGALISLVAGTIIFFNTGPSDQAVSPVLIVGAAAGVGVVAALVLRYALAARRGRIDTGLQGLIGKEAIVIQPFAPTGRVRVLGEDWSANLVEGDHLDGAAATANVGEHVRVVGAEGLRLQVTPSR